MLEFFYNWNGKSRILLEQEYWKAVLSTSMAQEYELLKLNCTYFENDTTFFGFRVGTQLFFKQIKVSDTLQGP